MLEGFCKSPEKNVCDAEIAFLDLNTGHSIELKQFRNSSLNLSYIGTKHVLASNKDQIVNIKDFHHLQVTKIKELDNRV